MNARGHYGRALAVDPLESRVMLDVTISGTISYLLDGDTNGPNPLRQAYVTVSGLAGILPESTSTWTDDLGHYQAVLQDNAADVSNLTLKVTLRGGFDLLTGEPAFTINQPNGPGGTAGDVYTWFKSGGGTVAAGGSKVFDFDAAGEGNENTQTFSIFDAMTTGYQYYATLANRAASSVEVVYPATSGPVPFTPASFYYQPLNDNIYIPEPAQVSPPPWSDWDSIIHEYGHHVADVNEILGTSGGAHEPAYNLRYDGALDTLQLGDLSLAWAEGWADFFSVYAQRATNAKSLGILDVGDSLFLSHDLETRGTPSLGEDNELSVARILWDLVDADNDSEDHDRIAAGDQLIWNTIRNNEVIIVDQLWDLLAGSAPVAQKIDYGGIFMAHNISPEPLLAEILPGNTNVKFYFEIPHGIGVGGAAKGPLLRKFKVHVFDSELTEIWASPEWLEIDDAGAAIPSTSGTWTVDIDQTSKFITGIYTTTLAEWQAIAANPGAKRWIVEGISQAFADAEEFETGRYWSDDLQFYTDGISIGGYGSIYYAPTGTVTIYGTESADSFKVSQTGIGPNDTIRIMINGAPVVIPLAQVSRLQIFCLGGNDFVNGSEVLTVPLEIYGGLGDDTLIGGAANDEISGHDGNDTIDGRGGADLLYGDGDNDRLEGDAGNDTLVAGAGNDTYVFDSDSPQGADVILGPDDPGNDTLDFGSSSSTPITINLSLTTPQVVVAGSHTLTLPSESAIENVKGTSANDTITGNSVSNKLEGKAGNDTIDGKAGDDALEGSAGNDSLKGGDGNDTYIFILFVGNDLGADTIQGPDDPGLDLLDFSTSEAAVKVDLALATWQNLAPGILRLKLPSSTAIENVLGGKANDVILGNGQVNYIAGNEGNDTIDGRGSDDWLEGRDGDDKIYGGGNLDIIDGGGGQDLFYPETSRDGSGNAPAEFNFDWITSIQVGEKLFEVIRLGGRNAGTEYDQVEVTTTAVLAGNLDVSLIGGFIPVLGDTFDVLTATGAVQGRFDAVKLPPLPNPNHTWKISYLPNKVQLEVVSNTGVPNMTTGTFQPYTPTGEVVVTYTITDTAATPFDVGIFADYDDPTPDGLVGSWHVDDPALLAIGIHQLPLPLSVAALPADATAYVWLDHHHDVVETNEQDNITPFFVGAFQSPDGTIYVWGGDGGDTVSIGQSTTVDVTINANPFVFIIPPEGIPLIVINTFGGDDDVDVVGAVSIPMDGNLGSGDDSIVGGNGGNTIDAGDGDDEVYGGGGNDIIFGGDGNDTIYAGDGDDTVDAGDGDDYVNGWTGADIILGGLGADTVNGDIGPDIVTGGFDWLAPYADGSADVVQGGSEDDSLWGATSEGDTFDGGSGDDTINGVGDGGEGLDGVSGGSTAGSAAPVFLSQADLLAFLNEGRRRWVEAGIDAASSVALDDVRLYVTDLPSPYLGVSFPGLVVIDVDAAGAGWFVDLTPADDSEFPTYVFDAGYVASAGTAPTGRFDLLTVFMHELGHQAGFGHTDGVDAMSPGLPVGVRRLPSMEAVAINAGPESGPQALVASPDGRAIEAHLSMTDVHRFLAARDIQVPADWLNRWAVTASSHVDDRGGTQNERLLSAALSDSRIGSAAWAAFSVRSFDAWELNDRITAMVQMKSDGLRFAFRNLEIYGSATLAQSAHPRPLNESVGVAEKVSSDDASLRSGTRRWGREPLGRRAFEIRSAHADELTLGAIAAARARGPNADEFEIDAAFHELGAADLDGPDQ